MRSILVTVGVALAVACLTVVASAAGERREYRVLYGGHEKSQRRKTCDVVNGEPQILESQIGFLLRAPEESKYYDVERLAESVPLEVALRGCRLTFPEGLAVEVVDLEVGVANVALSDKPEFTGDNHGLGIRCAVRVEAAADLPEGVREIVVSFPGVMTLKQQLQAVSPAAVPAMTFQVHNFTDKQALGATRWKRSLLLGCLSLAGMLVCISIAVAADSEENRTADSGHGVLGLIIGAVAASLATLYFFGMAAEQLSFIQTWLPWLVFGGVNLPIALVCAMLASRTSGSRIGLLPLAIAVVVGLACYLLAEAGWREWVTLHIALGAAVVMPGCLIGAVAGSLVRSRAS